GGDDCQGIRDSLFLRQLDDYHQCRNDQKTATSPTNPVSLPKPCPPEELADRHFPPFMVVKVHKNKNLVSYICYTSVIFSAPLNLFAITSTCFSSPEKYH